MPSKFESPFAIRRHAMLIPLALGAALFVAPAMAQSPAPHAVSVQHVAWRGRWGWRQLGLSGGWGFRGGWGCCWGGYAYPPAYYPGYYAAPYPYPAPAPATNTLPQPLPRSFDLSVQFATGSARLTPQADTLLDQLGRQLSSNQLVADRFRIEGHTDTVGDRLANLSLSQRRAEAVASYLESNFNIQPDRLEAIGVGENDLAVQTPDQTAELRNRRVHVENLSA